MYFLSHTLAQMLCPFLFHKSNIQQEIKWSAQNMQLKIRRPEVFI